MTLLWPRSLSVLIDLYCQYSYVIYVIQQIQVFFIIHYINFLSRRAGLNPMAWIWDPFSPQSDISIDKNGRCIFFQDRKEWMILSVNCQISKLIIQTSFLFFVFFYCWRSVLWGSRLGNCVLQSGNSPRFLHSKPLNMVDISNSPSESCQLPPWPGSSCFLGSGPVAFRSRREVNRIMRGSMHVAASAFLSRVCLSSNLTK